MAVPLADPADVGAIWRSLDGLEELAQAQRLLEFASALVRSRVRSVDARIASGDLDEALVRNVVASMVARVMRTRDQHRPDAAQAAAEYVDLVMTDDEVAVLQPQDAAGVSTILVAPALGFGWCR